MANFKFVLNPEGVKELLQSPGMQAIIKETAAVKASEAGEGYAYDVKIGQKRAYANIYPETQKARQDNLENNTLEKVIRT